MIIVLAAVCGVFAALLVFDILVRNTRYAVFCTAKQSPMLCYYIITNGSFYTYSVSFFNTADDRCSNSNVRNIYLHITYLIYNI